MKVYFCAILIFALSCTFAEVKSEEANKERHLFPVARDGKLGFIDQDGKIVLPCEYSMYTCPETTRTLLGNWFRDAFEIANDNYLKVMDEENNEGQLCYLPEKWGYEGIIPIVKDGKVGFLRENGTVIVEPKYTGAAFFRNGRVWVSNEKGEYLFLDNTGKVLMDGIEDAGYGDMQFHIMNWTPDSPPFPVKKGGKWGFIDWSGKLVVPCQFDDIGYMITKKLNSVQYQGRFQMVDGKGNIYDYKWIRNLGNGNYVFLNRKTNGCGVYNEEKGWITSQKYNDFGNLSEGLRAFQQKDEGLKWGYMDENENVVIPPQFDIAFVFHNGLALVGIESTSPNRLPIMTMFGSPLIGKFGYINKKGKYVWEPSWGPIPKEEDEEEVEEEEASR